MWSITVRQHRGVIVAPPSPSPRRIGVPRWIDARLIVGVLLVAVSVVTGAHVLGNAQARIPLLAFTRDLAAGTSVQHTDVTLVRVALPRAQLPLYLKPEDELIGTTLAHAVSRGELVAQSVVGLQTSITTVVIPLAAGAAPALHRGERIVVWTASDTCGLVELIHDVTVQSVDRDDGLSGASRQLVAIDLPDDAAFRVAKTLSDDTAVLRAGVVSGASRRVGSGSGRCTDVGG